VRILAVDTAGARCAAAVVDAGRVEAAESATMTRGHAEALAPMVKRVLASAGVGAADCDRFAVTTGPGSFTGIRVGLAFVRALALATGRPAVGVDRFRAFAAAADAGPDARVLVALDSRRGTAFVLECGSGAPDDSGQPEEMEPDALTERIQMRPSLPVAGDILDADAAVDPAVLARLAESADPAPPRPFYLRPPDAVAARAAP
jgi:tRNA threonylcarbamoyladenosine biosynthesis protein TsaB